jgi:putative membrane protein
MSSPAALAHSSNTHATGWATLAFDPWIGISLLLATGLYARGLYCLWSNSHHGAGVPVRQTACFFSGLTILALALLSPVDTIGAELFSMHMVQHELLMLGAAPLIVLGRPLAVFLWAFPAHWRKRIGRMIKAPAIRYPWHAITRPFTAWTQHAIVLWAWHFPTLFQAGLADDIVHAIQHFSFLLSALLLWSSLMGAHSRLRYAAAVMYLLATAIHTGILGALLTFSTSVWYPVYSGTTEAWGLTVLEDQQLGGLIMWVPAGFVFILTGLAMAAKAIAPDWHDVRHSTAGPERRP